MTRQSDKLRGNHFIQGVANSEGLPLHASLVSDEIQPMTSRQKIQAMIKG